MLRRLLLGSVLLVSGCDAWENSTVCPAVVRPAVEVEIRNAVTTAPEARNAEGRLVDGRYVDSMRVSGSIPYQGQLVPLTLIGGRERPGTYTVLIEKPHFQAWSRTGVWVGQDECGVNTRRLKAELEPVHDGSDEATN